MKQGAQDFPRAQLSAALVRHTRLKPVVHGFAYPVFQLRLPVRSLTHCRLTNAFLSHNRFNLLSFHDSDHGDGHTTPAEWIDRLLHEAGVTDASGEVWLHTFPRVLGYVFNPVSFWFCHRQDGALRAVVCEVNNTFGERHCYLLADPDGLRWGRELTARKCFHVSPFLERGGVYRFRFLQVPALKGKEQVLRHVARIDYESDEGILLKTSIGGTARTLTTGRTLRAFLRMPLMTLAMMVRIHFQALLLWLRRVPFVPKPAPPQLPVSQ